MPYPKEHAARVEDPDIFENDSFRRNEIAPGVEIIVGKHRNADTTATQAYRFYASKFTADQAKQWLKDNNVKYISFEEASMALSEYIIPVYGLIGSPSDENDKAEYFSFDKFLLHINKAKDYQQIAIDIKSDGGYVDVADKMIDVLSATKKKIRCFNSGNVCSAASKLFTLADRENRQFDPTKGVFLIHNPWGNVVGDALEMANASKELQGIENEYAKWYADRTGADINVIKAYMKENIPLTHEQIQELGFATVIQPSVKAVALINNNKKQQKMDKELGEKINVFSAMLDKIMAKLKIKALMLTDVDGNELDFPDLNDPNEVKAGVKVNLGGKPFTGESKQPDGTILVCQDGVVNEVKPAQTDDMQALKDENANLKAEIEKMKVEKTTSDAALAEAVSSVKEIDKQFKSFKAQFSKENPPKGNPPSSGVGKNKLSREEIDKELGL